MMEDYTGHGSCHSHGAEEPSCCGHDHGHSAHGHGEPCGDPNCTCHDHGHHHDHDHHHEEHTHAPISVISHDPATVGSVQCTVPLPYQEAVAEIEKRMRAIAGGVTEAGGFIGHIKAIIEEDARRCRLSITEEGAADRKWMEAGAACKADCVFIVFGVDCQSLQKMIEATFSDLL